MLQNDEIILNILLDAKENGNELLQHFKIGYPSKRIAQESNSIFVGVVDSESYTEGLEFSSYKDLVEIIIATKMIEYRKNIQIIKTTAKEIVRLIYENSHLFDNKPVIRNLTPEYNSNFVVTKGHLMVQVKTAPISFESDDDEIKCVCNLIVNEITEV